MSYRLVPAVDAHQEQRLCDEQADAQVLVDGVTVALQAAEEAEGEEADEEADQRQEDAHPGDHVQEHVMDRVCVLHEEGTKEEVNLQQSPGQTSILEYIGHRPTD